MDTELFDKLNLTKLSFNLQGRLTEIDEGIFGFSQKDGKIILVNPNTMIPLDKPYNLRLLDANIIVLDSILLGYLSESYIIDRNTFDIIYKTNYSLISEGDLLYESPGEMSIYDKDVKILNRFGKEIYNLVISNGINITSIANTSLYMTQYHINIKEDKPEDVLENLGFLTNDSIVTEIISYTPTMDKAKQIWKSFDYSVDIISESKLLFMKKSDYSEQYVYDFNKKKIISEQC